MKWFVNGPVSWLDDGNDSFIFFCFSRDCTFVSCRFAFRLDVSFKLFNELKRFLWLHHNLYQWSSEPVFQCNENTRISRLDCIFIYAIAWTN